MLPTLRNALAVLALTPLTAFAQVATQAPDWTLTTPNVAPYAMVLDGDLHAVTVGTINQSNVLSLHVSKANRLGTPLWQVVYPQPGEWRSVAVDGAGSIVAGGFTRSPTGTIASLVVKYDANGTLLWQDQMPEGLVWSVLNGTSNQTYAYASHAPTTGSSYVQLTKYDIHGTKMWSRQVQGRAPSYHPMIQDGAGNIVIASTDLSGTGTTISVFDAAGTLLRSHTDNSFSSALRMTLGQDGSIFVMGVGAGLRVLKLSPSLIPNWAVNLPVGYTGDAVVGAALPTGEFMLAGTKCVFPSDSGSISGGFIQCDWHLAKVSAQGGVLWTKDLGELGAGSAPKALVLAPDNALYLHGQGLITRMFNGVAVASRGAVTYKLDLNGNPLWVHRVTSLSQATDMRLGKDGSLLTVSGGEISLNQEPQTLHHFLGVSNLAPKANASASVVSGTSPLTVALRGDTSTDAEGPIAGYQWDFGDGQSAGIANPSHTYTLAGSYRAVLTVKDALGVSAQSTPITITVAAPLALKSLTVPLSIRQRSTGTGSVASTGPAGPTGLAVSLVSSHPTALTVPSQVTIPAGASLANFAIKTASVRQNTAVTITASAHGAIVKQVVTVRR